MPKQTTHLPVVRQWCLSLAVLTAVSISRQEAEMKLAAYVPMLKDRFPDGAFTTASLEHVARQCVKGFPTYPELAGHLSGWWREHRPMLPALPPPPPIRQRDEPTPEEIAHVEALVREVTAALRASAEATAEQAARLDAATGFRRTAHLSPGVLDAINPLPNGRKRTDATTPATATASAAAAVDPHAA
jgi:hypothetical protein